MTTTRMRKNLIYLTKWCLKYSIVVALIILLIRYTFRINLTLTTRVEINEQASNVEILRRLVNELPPDTQASLDFDFSFSLVDAKNHNDQSDRSSSSSFINVNNFSSFLHSRYFFYDREFNNTKPLRMCPYLPPNLSIYNQQFIF